MKWHILLGCMLLLACSQAPVPEPEIEYETTIIAMGDSLTAGLGVNQDEAYPSQLQKQLRERGYSVEVVNAGISGETSSAALSRTNWVLSLEPDIVIVETGPNDGLRGIDPSLTRENIANIVETMQSRNVTVVLAGMQIVQNMGPEYTQEFKEIYPSIAQEYDITLVPFFLEGVAANSSLNQDDEIHPTAQGYSVIVENMLPYVEEALRT